MILPHPCVYSCTITTLRLASSRAGIIIARLVGWPSMCGYSGAVAALLVAPHYPSCSARRLPRRRAESASTKLFRSNARARFKNEDHARPVEPGWPPDSLRHANHTVLTSMTSFPSNPTSGASIPRDYSCAATTTTSAIARGHDKSLSPSNDLQRHQHCSFNVRRQQLHQKPYSNLLQEVIFRRKYDVIGGLPKDAECGGRQRVPSMWKGAEY